LPTQTGTKSAIEIKGALTHSGEERRAFCTYGRTESFHPKGLLSPEDLILSVQKG